MWTLYTPNHLAFAEQGLAQCLDLFVKLTGDKEAIQKILADMAAGEVYGDYLLRTPLGCYSLERVDAHQ